MAESFEDLEDHFGGEATIEVDEDILAQKIDYDKIFLACYNTKAGRRMIDTMAERFMNIPIYVQGATLEATSYRQGKADLVRDIFKAVEDALNPPKKN